MEWDEKFEQGVIWQDFQHKQFIDNLNILLHMVTSKVKDGRAFNRVANFTIQYCNNHFKTEELYSNVAGKTLSPESTEIAIAAKKE